MEAKIEFSFSRSLHKQTVRPCFGKGEEFMQLRKSNNQGSLCVGEKNWY